MGEPHAGPWAHEKALLEQTYFPQPRDEDDVRVDAQWQEHVCRSNLVSGVSARVEGRGADSLPFGHLGQGFLGARSAGSSAVVSTQVYIETTKTPSGRQCPGGIP